MSAVSAQPVRVDGTLDPQLSRWLWLVKWLLAIPHFIVLTDVYPPFRLDQGGAEPGAPAPETGGAAAA